MNILGNNCSINLVGLNNNTFFYSVIAITNDSYSSSLGKSETRNISIRNYPSLIQLNSPINNTINQVYSWILNWTINNTQNDDVITKGYIARNTTGNITKQIFYWNEGNLNGSYIYNFTAMPTFINKSQQLWALYKFYNDSAFTESFSRIYDFSGNNKNGTYKTNQSLREGKFGKGIFIKDSTYYASFNSEDYANISVNGMTVNVWVNLTSNATLNDSYVVTRWNNNNIRKYFLLYITQGKPIFYLLSDGIIGCITLGTKSISLNQWHMITGMWDDALNVTRTYIDGSLNNQTTCSFDEIT